MQLRSRTQQQAINMSISEKKSTTHSGTRMVLRSHKKKMDDSVREAVDELADDILSGTA